MAYSRQDFYSIQVLFHVSRGVGLPFPFVGCLSATLFLSRLHKFSMVFKSGLFPGQSIVLIFFFFKNSLTIFDLWHGAMCNCSFSCNISSYLAPFMVVPFGRKKSPAVPFDDIAPHIITLGGCFIVATVYRSSKHVPTGLRNCCLRVPNCWIVDSSEKITFPHCFSLQSAYLFANITLLAFIASVSLGLFAGL